MTKLFDYHQAPILQSPNQKLVYIPTLKCASSYYTKTFYDHGWKQIDQSDIDWDNQYTFGFLIDPLSRYAKGAATDMSEMGMENIIMNFVGSRFWEFPPILGIHTVPITCMYKSVYNKINWLLLDKNCESNLRMLFDKFNETVSLPSQRVNESSDHQIEIVNKIKKLVAGPGETWYNMLYPEEIELYNRVKANDTK